MEFDDYVVNVASDGKLYWCDAGLDYIASMNLDGSDRQTLISVSAHFFGLIVVEETLLVSDWDTRYVTYVRTLV